MSPREAFSYAHAREETTVQRFAGITEYVIEALAFYGQMASLFPPKLGEAPREHSRRVRDWIEKGGVLRADERRRQPMNQTERDDLDAKVLAAVRGGERQFVDIAIACGFKGAETNSGHPQGRRVDAALQRLRKAGTLTWTRAEGWKVAK